MNFKREIIAKIRLLFRSMKAKRAKKKLLEAFKNYPQSIRKLSAAYENFLKAILKPVHRLIHATTEETIQKYLTLLNLNNTQIQKVNKLRELAGNEPIK